MAVKSTSTCKDLTVHLIQDWFFKKIFVLPVKKTGLWNQTKTGALHIPLFYERLS